MAGRRVGASRRYGSVTVSTGMDDTSERRNAVRVNIGNVDCRLVTRTRVKLLEQSKSPQAGVFRRLGVAWEQG